MHDAEWHIAEINVARTLAPLSDPSMADFVAQLDVINHLADESPGFVWRLKADNGGASSYIRFADDERTLVNMSVWTSLEALHAYVYRSAHGEVFRDRRKWFGALDGPPLALWWITEGQVPTIEEGIRRLQLLGAHGPSPAAFTFKQRFPKPQALVVNVPAGILSADGGVPRCG